MMNFDSMLQCDVCMKILREEWCGLGYAIRALFYTITGGLSWGELSIPFWRMSFVHGYVYLIFVVLVIFGLLNILVGIFVTKTEDIRSWDRDGVLGRALESRRGDMEFFQELFREIDTTGSGTIDEDDFADSLMKSRIQAYFHMLQIHYSNPRALFRMMDENGNGRLDIQEFTEACLRFQNAAKTSDVVEILQVAQSLDRKLMRLMASRSRRLSNSGPTPARRRSAPVLA